MRWIQHWKIGKECLGRYSSLAFQLGTILPDWFERKHVHKIDDTLDLVLNRIDIISKMPRCIKRDFMLGTVVHFITDYCCFAHVDENYNSWIGHRIFEVRSQKLYLANDTYKYILNMDKFYNEFKQTKKITNNIYIDVLNYLHFYQNKLQYRYRVPHIKWYYDENIMKTDTYYAYNMIYGIMELLGEFNTNTIRGYLYLV